MHPCSDVTHDNEQAPAKGIEAPPEVRAQARSLVGRAGSFNKAAELVGVNPHTLARIVTGETVSRGTLALYAQNVDKALEKADVIYAVKLSEWGRTKAANDRRAPLPRIEATDALIERIQAELEADQKRKARP